MMTDVNDSEVLIEQKPTVGQRLCHARQVKNLTIAEVATELRLTKQTIEIIENERWNELHGRAYARGYFSNYVKFLGLPEDELLAAFNIEYTGAEPNLLTARHHVEISSHNSSWLSSLFFITVLVIGWFVYQQMQTTTDVVPEELSPLLPFTEANKTGLNDSVNTQINEIITENAQQQVNELVQPARSDAEYSISNEQTENVANASSEIITSKELETVELQDLAQEVTNNDELVLENTTAVASAEAVLDLRFSDECWVEVKDVNNKVLLRKLMIKDDSIILTGQAPLTVMLGRASVAQVRFNDQLFDSSAFSQRDVARFTLGAES